MAGTIIADYIRADANKISLNVGNTVIASINASGILSNTGTVMIGANGQLQSGAVPDGIITQSKIATGVAGTGPYFHASINTNDAKQSLPNATYTKVIFDYEMSDTNNNYDPTTNYRFTPTVAGYYMFTFRAQLQPSAGAGGEFFLNLVKNNFDLGWRSTSSTVTASVDFAVSGSAIAYANGTTDYFQVYAYQSSGVTKQLNNFGVEGSFFQGVLIKAA